MHIFHRSRRKVGDTIHHQLASEIVYGGNGMINSPEMDKIEQMPHFGLAHGSSGGEDTDSKNTSFRWPHAFEDKLRNGCV
jgi:hypothetical protein